MRANQLTVEVRDRTLKRIGQIRPSELNLKAILRWCGVGEWTLTLPGNHPMVPALQTPGSGLVVTARDSFGVLLETVFSGPTIRPQRKRDVKNPEGTLTFVGVTDEILLEDAEAFPSPAVADPAAQTQENDVRSGKSEALMRQYVAYNIASTHAPAGRVRGFRQYLKLSGGDLGRGVTQTKAPRYQNLLELLQEIATTDGGLGFRLVQVGSELHFQVTDVVDRRKSIRLDMANGTLVGEETTSQGPTLTDAIVLGQGEGTQRQVERRTQLWSEATWNRPIERSFDQRQTSDVAVLRAKGDEELAKGKGGLAAKVIPADETTMQYLKDWKQGDWITVVVDGVEQTSVVTEAVLIFNEKQSGVGVSVGDVSTFNPSDSNKKQQQSIDSRVAYLEKATARQSLSAAGQRVTDWNNAIDAGFYWSDTGAANGPGFDERLIGVVSIKPGGGGVYRVQQDVSFPTTDPGRFVLTMRRIKDIGAGTWGPWRMVNGKGEGPTSARTVVVPNYLDEWYDTTDGFLYLGSKTGTWRRKSGLTSWAASAWDATVGTAPAATYAGKTIGLSIPTVLETNEHLLFQLVTGGSGYTFIGGNSITRGASSTTLTIRFMQLGSFTTQAGTIAWQIAQI